eukprot:TRINITY_DN58993_c0_g1_i1.p1 TRINITY_DN58993_c0_g1~~TRINITY_DN58993_c0_g1_i1.p1  ORF type:complete len:400 (-),score=44.74 TRINITY_DN58993_c0_g1_i1:81-1256(-)
MLFNAHAALVYAWSLGAIAALQLEGVFLESTVNSFAPRGWLVAAFSYCPAVRIVNMLPRELQVSFANASWRDLTAGSTLDWACLPDTGGAVVVRFTSDPRPLASTTITAAPQFIHCAVLNDSAVVLYTSKLQPTVSLSFRSGPHLWAAAPFDLNAGETSKRVQVPTPPAPLPFNAVVLVSASWTIPPWTDPVPLPGPTVTFTLGAYFHSASPDELRGESVIAVHGVFDVGQTYSCRFRVLRTSGQPVFPSAMQEASNDSVIFCLVPTAIDHLHLVPGDAAAVELVGVYSGSAVRLRAIGNAAAASILFTYAAEHTPTAVPDVAEAPSGSSWSAGGQFLIGIGGLMGSIGAGLVLFFTARHALAMVTRRLQRAQPSSPQSPLQAGSFEMATR